MLHDALDITTGPVMIRWSKTMAPSVPDDQVGHGLRGRKVRSGTDVCFVGVGKMLAAAEDAAELLEGEGISASVWDPRVVSPFHPDLVADAATHRVVVSIEDGIRVGGVGSLLAEQIDELTLAEHRRSPRVAVMGVPVAYIPHGKADAILTELGLDADGIAATARAALAALD